MIYTCENCGKCSEIKFSTEKKDDGLTAKQRYYNKIKNSEEFKNKRKEYSKRYYQENKQRIIDRVKKNYRLRENKDIHVESVDN